MARNIMVEYVGPKKSITVPFPEDGSFPLKSMADPHVNITFPKKQPAELTPKQAEVLLKACPQTFKACGTVRVKSSVATEITEEEYASVEGDSDTARQDS